MVVDSGMPTIGSKLRTLRKARRLTQQELAEGIASASLISQIESGRVPPSQHIIQSLSQRLQVDVEYFADDMARKEQSQLYRRAKSLIGLDRYLEAADILAELAQSPPPQLSLRLSTMTWPSAIHAQADSSRQQRFMKFWPI